LPVVINDQSPDYPLDDTMVLTSAKQVKAVGDPLRTTILGLLHERAASVSELAAAVGRPKSTVAHHVKVLADAGLLRVIRTRRVRALEERYYGRTARVFYASLGRQAGGEELPLDFNDFEVAAHESATAYETRRLRAFLRHARIPEQRAAEFWARVEDLIQEFDRVPRSGNTTYGFAVGLYPLPGYPTLPPAGSESQS
jgi:DNA-binding transcriptional ArsR family regulator